MQPIKLILNRGLKWNDITKRVCRITKKVKIIQIRILEMNQFYILTDNDSKVVFC